MFIYQGCEGQDRGSFCGSGIVTIYDLGNEQFTVVWQWTVIMFVEEYFLHPNPTGVWNDPANLAIIVFTYPAVITTAVRPICIWPATRIDDAMETMLYMVGFEPRFEQIDRGIYKKKYMKLSRFLIRPQVNIVDSLN